MKRPSDSPAQAVTEAVFRSLLRVWGVLRQAQEPYFSRFGITASQWGVLRVLQQAELAGLAELSLKEVSERLLIQPPSVTGVVDRLERLGFVMRSPSATDLRVRHLGLTPPGRALMAKVLAGHGERIHSLLAGLEPQEQETMLGLLKRLETHLRGLVSAPPTPATPRHEAKGKRRPRRKSPAPGT